MREPPTGDDMLGDRASDLSAMRRMSPLRDNGSRRPNHQEGAVQTRRARGTGKIGAMSHGSKGENGLSP